MTFDRRDALLGGLGLGMGLAASVPPLAPARAATPPSPATAVPVTAFGVRPNDKKSQTRALQKAIDQTTESGFPLYFPPGDYRTGELHLRSRSQLLGTGPQSRLVSDGSGRFLQGEGITDVRLSGLTLSGAKKPLAPEASPGLVTLRDVTRFQLENCVLEDSAGHGIALFGCAGQVRQTEIRGAAQTGLFSEDAQGLLILGNHVHHCDNNGIQIWGSRKRQDGTQLLGNRITHIAAKDGGDGQNGNGINVFRAGGVLVSGNHIADCAFTAIRANSADNVQMIGNSCHGLGEVALYAEFTFTGAVISGNLVDGAATGISVTNFREGGRLAVIQGNLVRNLFLRDHPEDRRGIGIGVEADAAVTGNVVEEAPAAGISVGWGKYLRNVSVANNVIRRAHIGIMISADFNSGYVMVTSNMISETQQGAIRAMDHGKPLGPDLTRSSAESFRNFAIFNNVGLQPVGAYPESQRIKPRR